MADRWDEEAEAVVDAWCRRMQIVEDYEVLVASVSAALRDTYERGLREGREAERADVVAWLGGPAIDLANPVMRDCMEELCGMVASPIARAEHVPAPQGDEECRNA